MTVPSVLDVLVARSWTLEAACAGSDDTWILDTQFGRENAGSVVARFEVCAICTVRRECLLDAITEDSYTVMGVCGGTVTSERSAIVSELGARHCSDSRTQRDLRLQAAEMLEATFADRLEGWRQARDGVTAAEPPPAASCRRCGERLSWRQRSDASYCSGACRQAAYRARAA